MADENLGLDVKNEPSNEVNEGTAVPEKTTEQGSLETEKKPAGLWTAQLPKELKDNEDLTVFGTIGDLAKAYLKEKATPKAETDKVGVLDKILGDNEKEWGEFRSEYVKEGQDGTNFDNFIKLAKNSTLTPKQAKALLENTQKVQQESMQKQMEDAPKKCEEFLKKQWGDGYDKGVQNVKKGISKILTNDEFSQKFKKTYQNDPFILEFVRRVGEMLEDKPNNAFMARSNNSQKSDNVWGIPKHLFNK